jgi:arginyl-tRNA synthetase
MFAKWAKDDPSAEDRPKRCSDSGRPVMNRSIELWKLMNGWTLDGLQESYEKMGIIFDAYYYESETYKYG